MEIMYYDFLSMNEYKEYGDSCHDFCLHTVIIHALPFSLKRKVQRIIFYTKSLFYCNLTCYYDYCNNDFRFLRGNFAQYYKYQFRNFLLLNTLRILYMARRRDAVQSRTRRGLYSILVY